MSRCEWKYSKWIENTIYISYIYILENTDLNVEECWRNLNVEDSRYFWESW